MLNMVEHGATKINQLERELPEGLVVDSTWLEERQITSNLRAYYVKSGWLEQPVRGIYKKPRGDLTWQQVVISLQTLLLRAPFTIGGRTALELQGFAHYLTRETKDIHLYGPKPLPGWLKKLDLPQRFIYHNSGRLFRGDPITFGVDNLAWNIERDTARNPSALQGGSLTELSWGHWDWSLTLSTPERAYLEMLDELPKRESFHQADVIMQGAVNFSPRRLQKLLQDCSSIKVKRLFFFFADRQRHSWLRYVKKDKVDLGTGKRMLVKGGRLDPTYLITVPEDLYGDQ